ncbi:unnamed protein product, partial [Ectocarpus sp. 4 AP-2014]
LDHPAVATTLNNWAALLESQEKNAEAIQQLERALSIRTKKLGRNHRETVNTQKGLNKAREKVTLCRQQDRSNRAEEALDTEEDSADVFEAPSRCALDSVNRRLPGATPVGLPPMRQLWLQSCGDINPGGRSSTGGVALTMHSLSREVLRDASDEAFSGESPTQRLFCPSGGMSGAFHSRR